MKHSDFRIGQDFWCDAHHWRCTDIGTRTMPFVLIVLTWQEFQMVAFKVWDMMPLQKRAVQEHVFDEEAISDCVREYEPITVVFPTLQKPVTLSPEQTAKVWRAVSAGQYASPEEYVNTAIETLLKRLGERDKASKAEDLMDRYVNTLNELG